VASCNEPSKKNSNKNTPFDEEKVKEPLVQANQSSVRLEDEDIDLYVKRQNLDVTKTETGLRYQITKKGKGKLIKAIVCGKMIIKLNDIIIVLIEIF
jgi:hypothetical protein